MEERRDAGKEEDGDEDHWVVVDTNQPLVLDNAEKKAWKRDKHAIKRMDAAALRLAGLR